MLCVVHRVSFIHTAVTNLDSKSIQASVPVGPDAKTQFLYQEIKGKLRVWGECVGQLRCGGG